MNNDRFSLTRSEFIKRAIVVSCALAKKNSRASAAAAFANEMAWRSHGVDNESLISALERNGIVRTQKVSEAMRRVDRANYCPAFSGKRYAIFFIRF